MGAPSTAIDPTMSKIPPKTWKARFAGGLRPGSGDQSKDVSTITEDTSFTAPSKASVEGERAGSKSLRFKKKMSGRFRHLLPTSIAKASASSDDSSPSNPQTPLSASDETHARGQGAAIDVSDLARRLETRMNQPTAAPWEMGCRGDCVALSINVNFLCLQALTHALLFFCLSFILKVQDSSVSMARCHRRTPWHQDDATKGAQKGTRWILSHRGHIWRVGDRYWWCVSTPIHFPVLTTNTH